MKASGLRETSVGMASIVSPSGGEDHADECVRASSRDDGASIRKFLSLTERDSFYHTRERHIVFI